MRTAEGVLVGAYCVFDEAPRPGLTPDEESFLEDIAKSAMDHLEAQRIRAEFERRSKLVSGLESFIDGYGTLPDHKGVSF